MAKLHVRRPRAISLFVAGGLLGATVGVANGAIPATGTNVYSACYGTDGTVRFIDTAVTQTCPRNFKGPVTWGAVGPEGAQGIQGPQGLQGIQGVQGIQGLPGAAAPGVEVYFAKGSGTAQKVLPHPGGQSGSTFFLSVSVPAGDYVVEAQFLAEDYPNLLFCHVEDNGGRLRFHDDAFGDEPFGDLTLTATASLTSAGSITAGCSAGGEVQLGITQIDASVTATKVASVN